MLQERWELGRVKPEDSNTAAEMLAGRWENKGILTAAQVCIEELSTQGCSCDAAVPG